MMNSTPQGADRTRIVRPVPPPGAPSGSEPAWGAVFTPLAPQDPREISGYLLRARIGEGGMGAVYLTYTPGGRPVALKIARPEFAADPEFRRRFEKEVAIAQRVQGLYTAPVIDCDPHAPQPWLATAYVAAPSLAAAVARQGPLPPETVLVLLAGVAEALQSIHAAGVIHRDLKPGNVILAADGPRVIDFGISRAVENSSAALTQTGVRIGTPAFMAPEQVRGKSLDTSGDIFSLGSTAYYAITGELPFGGDAAVFHRIVYEQPEWDRCPEQVRSVLERCVDKDPAGRPTPAALIELCRAASTDERLRIGEGWLPPTVTADLTRYSLIPPKPSPPLQPTKAEHPRPPAPSPWSPAPPGPPHRKGSPWLIVGVSAAALALAAVIVLLTTLSNTPSDQASRSGATTATSTGKASTGNTATNNRSATTGTGTGTGSASNKPTTTAVTSGPATEHTDRTLSVPAALVGRWEGVVSQPSGHPDKYPTRLELRNGRIGEVVGSVTYPTFPCGGSLTLIVGGDETRVQEKISDGGSRCADNGEIRLYPQSDGTLRWEYYYGPGNFLVDTSHPAATAMLSRY